MLTAESLEPAESLEEMAARPEWQLWATKGRTLQQRLDGQVQAVNWVARMATEEAKVFGTLLKRLRHGKFDYKYFVSFKQQATTHSNEQ